MQRHKRVCPHHGTIPRKVTMIPFQLLQRFSVFSAYIYTLIGASGKKSANSCRICIMYVYKYLRRLRRWGRSSSREKRRNTLNAQQNGNINHDDNQQAVPNVTVLSVHNHHIVQTKHFHAVSNRGDWFTTAAFQNHAFTGRSLSACCLIDRLQTLCRNNRGAMEWWRVHSAWSMVLRTWAGLLAVVLRNPAERQREKRWKHCSSSQGCRPQPKWYSNDRLSRAFSGKA